MLMRPACVWGKVVGKTDKISDRHARHGLSGCGIAHGPVAAVQGWREPASTFRLPHLAIAESAPDNFHRIAYSLFISRSQCDYSSVVYCPIYASSAALKAPLNAWDAAEAP
jgi:hypothetical protein